MSFGSGDIQTVIATDEVSVGGVKTSMENGLLLMVDKALNIEGPFEGILGLGLPASARWGGGLVAGISKVVKRRRKLGAS